MIRPLKIDELKKGIFKYSDFPIVLGLPSKFLLHKEGFYGNFQNNNLIAVCQIKFKKDKCIIKCIEVKGDYQRKGYGKELLKYIEKVANKKHCKYIELTPRDYLVHEFYKKLGYRLVKEKLMIKEI